MEVRPKRSSTATAHAANDRMSDDGDGDDDHRVGGNMGVSKNMIASFHRARTEQQQQAVVMLFLLLMLRYSSSSYYCYCYYYY